MRITIEKDQLLLILSKYIKSSEELLDAVREIRNNDVYLKELVETVCCEEQNNELQAVPEEEIEKGWKKCKKK